jgi:hypothetical protein
MAKEEEKKVIFRRVRGRVVPIRVEKREQERRALAGALGLSAVGAGAAGGVIQKQLARKARTTRAESFRAMGLAERALGIRNRRAKAARLKLLGRAKKAQARKLFSIAKKSRPIAIGIGGILLGEAIQRAVPEGKTTSQEFAIDAVSNLGGAAVSAAFILGRKRLGIPKIFKKAKPKQEIFKPIQF